MDNLSKDFPAIYENFNSFLTNPNWNPILCPYHNDKNKSGSINPTLKRFMCFAGCKAKSFEQLEADLNGELDVKESNTEEMETPQEIIDKYKLEFSKRLNFYNDLKVYPKYDIDGDYARFYVGDKYYKRRFTPNITKDRFKKTEDMLYALEVNPPQKCIFLVEGEFDLFAIEACLKHLGKEWVGCVATLGANLSFKNLYKLKNKHIVILYDNDEAGYLGTKKAIELVKQHPDLNIKIYNTPIDLRPWDDKDPDETIKRIGVNLYSLWIKQLIDKYFTNKLNDAAYIEEFKEEIPVEKYSLYNKHLDTVTHGLPEGITVIAGDPKAGKSGFALSLARRYIQDKKSKVLYCTNEISKKQCWARLMSAPLDMDWVELEAEPIKMYEMAKTYSSHIRIEFMPTLEKIESMSHFYNIIFIDYIQLVPGEGNDKERIDRAMALFSKIASATTKRIVCLSSLSQEAYTGGKYIGQAKYKGSGNIEYGLQLGLRLYKVIEGNNIYTNVQVDYNTRGQNTASKYITYPHLNTFIGVEE